MANLSTLALSHCQAQALYKFQVMANRFILSTPKLLQHFLSTLSTLTILHIYFLINCFLLQVFGDSATVLRFSPVALPQNFFFGSPLPPKNYPPVGLRFSTVSTYPFYYFLFLILISFSFSSSQCLSANLFTHTFL